MSAALAQEHHADRARLTKKTARAARQAWREIDPDAIRESWATQLARLLAVVTGAQLAAARQSEPWIDRMVGDTPTAGRLVTDAFAGIASDGRALAGLLMFPAFGTVRALARGLSLAYALASGAALLELLVRTQVADAGRAADSVAMAVRPDILGYERIVHLPACGRCIILAGRLYRWSTGFLRHPRCNCTMQPVTREQRGQARPENAPGALYDQMTPEQRRKAFGQAGVQAIADGADLAQVVNSRRGMSTVTAYGRQVRTTREGVTRRGIAGARLITGDPTAFTAPRTGGDTVVVSEFDRQTRMGRQQRVRLRGARSPRLVPEEIYQLAEDRDHALRLLRLHGYIL